MQTYQSSPLSRRTIERSAAFASNVVASTAIVPAFNGPCFATSCHTQVKTSRCVSTSINRRVREMVE